jgi:hypothetical protein
LIATADDHVHPFGNEGRSGAIAKSGGTCGYGRAFARNSKVHDEKR